MTGRGKGTDAGKKNVTEKVRVRNVRGEYEALKQVFSNEKWTDGYLSSKVDVLKVTYSIICEVLGIQATYLHQIPEEHWYLGMATSEYSGYSSGYHPQCSQDPASIPPLEPPSWPSNDAPAMLPRDNPLPAESGTSLVCSEEVFYGKDSDEEECDPKQEDASKDGSPVVSSPPSHLSPRYQQSPYSSVNTLPPFGHLAHLIPVNEAHDNSFLFPYNSPPWPCYYSQQDFPHSVNMETAPLHHLSGLASPLRCYPYSQPQ